MRFHGVCYDAGTRYDEISSRRCWDAALVEREIEAICSELHCSSILVFGSALDRIDLAARLALERGLRVTVQPRSIDGDHATVLRQLAEAAELAESLRRDRPDVVLSVGCELSLFAAGVVAGETFRERSGPLLSGGPPSDDVQTRLNALLARAAGTARSRFGGELTYAAGGWEVVDWEDFDRVAVDHYRGAYNEASYVSQLRALTRLGKPVVVAEFGCCAYAGADQRGGAGAEIVSWTPYPHLDDPPQRSESTQARYLVELLEIFQAARVHEACVFQFVEPAYPHAADPRLDLDRASFALVKTLREDQTRADAPYRIEPKLAFHAVAAHYAANHGHR